jgi:hypothetical protein
MHLPNIKIYNQNIDDSFKKNYLNIFDSDKDALIIILKKKTPQIIIFKILIPLIESIKNKNNDMKESLGKKYYQIFF